MLLPCLLTATGALTGALGADLPEAEPPELQPLLALPLAVGNRWTYSDETRQVSETRFLFFLRNASVSREAHGTLELEVVGLDADSDRFELAIRYRPVEGEPTASHHTVWNEGAGTWLLDQSGHPTPLFLGEPLPGPLPTEQRACAVPLLGVEEGVCAAVGGGPLDAPHGLLAGELSRERASGGLATAVLGVVTVGLVIASEGAPIRSLELEESRLTAPPAPPSAFLDAYGDQDHRVAPWRLRWMIFRHDPTIAELAVAMTRTRGHHRAARSLRAMLRSLPEDERHRLLRASLVNRRESTARHLFLTGIPLLPSLSEEAAAALFAMPPDDPELMRALAAGQLPWVMEWLSRSAGRTDPTSLLLQLEKEAPPVVEMPAALLLLDQDSDRLDVLEHFMELLPEAEQADLADQLGPVVAAFGSNDRRLTAMKRLAPLLPETSRTERLLQMAESADWGFHDTLALLDFLLPHLEEERRSEVFLQLSEALDFDDNYLEALETGLPQLPPDEQLEVFLAVYHRLTFDPGRLTAVAQHPEVVAQASARQRAQLLEQVVFRDKRRQMRALLER